MSSNFNIIFFIMTLATTTF